ncbi:SAM-dependent methyltransferase [Williamsia sp.]|uniref:SAM-dependent methyltransferase n=1 Tax=Williamsia sp. TaxID=1872085 RepID=UPI001A299CE5|nr:SAM-dependent methyltransferase [Williamsia sp.]MBJ7290524.1 SAM-dependent methyltransferase [Williamsia sp.]
MRTKDDQWSITDSVGRTALLVALGRALETRSDSALISDPFAAQFVADSGETDLAPEHIEALLDADDDPTLTRAIDLLRNMMAARTQRIDAALTTANAHGCLQVAILASGLDARAYRLPWRAGTTVFEIDQPAVLDFKNRTLERLDATTEATRVTVACDLREDWLSALTGAGFRSDRPTVWLCEGLLPYLTSADQERLLTTIGAAAPADSVLVFDVPRASFDLSRMDFQAQAFGVEIDELMLDVGEFAAQDWLENNGWTTDSDTIGALLTSYGRSSVVFTEPTTDTDPQAAGTVGDAIDLVVAHRR